MTDRSALTGQPVRSLQTMLRTIGHLAGDDAPPLPDGIFGSHTAGAVRAFQQSNHLPVTGIVDLLTWEKIRNEYQQALAEQQNARPIQIILNQNQALQSERPYIYLAQSMLTFISEYNCDIPAPDFSGKVDAQTRKSVAAFQASCKIPVTGILDKQTWNALTDEFALYAQKEYNA